jgi:hypothetical protein
MTGDTDQILSRLNVIDRRIDSAFTEAAKQGGTLEAEVAINRQILESIKEIKGIGKDTADRMRRLEMNVAVMQADHMLLQTRISKLEKYAIIVVAVAIATVYIFFK